MTQFRRIPDSDIEFNSFVQTIYTYLNATSPGLAITNSERLGIPPALLGNFNGRVPPWNDNWALHQNPSTRTTTVNSTKDTMREEMEPVIRDIQNTAEVSPELTQTDRDVLRVPERDTTPTPVDAPTVNPDITIETREHLQVVVRIHNPIEPDTNAKPPGVAMTEFYQYIGNNPPDQTEWMHIGGTGRFLHTISYAEADLGKTAHIVARYRNSKGEFGPYSDPIQVVVS